MMKDLFWNIFTQSGNIEIYLAYCELKNFKENSNSHELINDINKVASCC